MAARKRRKLCPCRTADTPCVAGCRCWADTHILRPYRPGLIPCRRPHQPALKSRCPCLSATTPRVCLFLEGVHLPCRCQFSAHSAKRGAPACGWWGHVRWRKYALSEKSLERHRRYDRSEKRWATRFHITEYRERFKALTRKRES